LFPRFGVGMSAYWNWKKAHVHCRRINSCRVAPSARSGIDGQHCRSGLIYGIGVEEAEGKSNIHVMMTMTTPACPFGPELIREVKEVLSGMEGVGKVEVQITLTPPWTPDRMTEEARDELGIF